MKVHPSLGFPNNNNNEYRRSRIKTTAMGVVRRWEVRRRKKGRGDGG